jgi:hypothetical protein
MTRVRPTSWPYCAPFAVWLTALQALLAAVCIQRMKLKHDQQVPEWTGEKYIMASYSKLEELKRSIQRQGQERIRQRMEEERAKTGEKGGTH